MQKSLGQRTCLHIRIQRGPMGQPWRRVRGGSVCCHQLWPAVHVRCPHTYITQQKRIPSPCWKHTNPGQDEASTLQIQGCPLGPLDSLSPARYLIYTVEYLLWTILHFLSFYYWQCKCKCQWSPLWFPPNLKNWNEGQLLRTLVSKRSNHYGQRRPYLENLACVQEFFSRQSKSDEAGAVHSLQGLRSQQSRKLEHLLVQVHEWWASSAEKAPATNPS